MRDRCARVRLGRRLPLGGVVRVGRHLPGGGSFLQDQAQHEAEQATRRVCEQGGQGRGQHSVRLRGYFMWREIS